MPTYAQAYASPWEMGAFWAREATTAGTAPATNSANWFYELFVGLDDNPQRNEYTVPAMGRMPVMSYGQDEINHHDEPTAHVYYTESGLAPAVMVALLGDNTNAGTAETPGGAGPYTHSVVPGLRSTRHPTFALIRDTAALAGSPGQQFVYGTPQGITLNLDPNMPIICDIPFMSLWKTPVAVPTAATTVPNISGRMRSNQGVFHLKQNAGGATDYAAKILSGSIVIARTASEPIHAISTNSKDPVDFIPGTISLAVTCTMLYDSMASGTPYSDFLSDLQSGTSANPNIITYTDASGYGFSLTFYPGKWSIPTWDTSGNSTKITATMNAFQSPGVTANLTLLQNLTITNSSATTLVL